MQEDADDLACAYGRRAAAPGRAKVVRIEGAGHIPRIEPPPLNQRFVDIVLDLGVTPHLVGHPSVGIGVLAEGEVQAFECRSLPGRTTKADNVDACSPAEIKCGCFL